MTGAVAGLPVIPIGPMIRESAREADLVNKKYRECPVGSAVARYIRALEYAGYAKNTRDSYEQVLSWLATTHDDFDGIARFCAPDGPEFLEEFLADKWGRRSENTRAHRVRVLHGFFKWTTEKGMTPFNPMAGIRGPKNPQTVNQREAYERELVMNLIDSQPLLRDRLALGLLRLALRKNDLRMLQLKDIDLVRDVLRLNHAKGGTRQRIPLMFEELRQDTILYKSERILAAGEGIEDEYLMYPRGNPVKAMDPATVHRWFKKCLERAGLPTSIEMHAMRHTAGTEIYRIAGIMAAKRTLRHKSVGTTEIYVHPSDEDLRDELRDVDAAWMETRANG